MYEAEVLCDSLSPSGQRLTSVAVKYPHAVHKDWLRHRMMSRVVESFRARPTELLIEQLRVEAFRPEEFATRIAGMGQGDALARQEQEFANEIWDLHIANCLQTAIDMGELNIAKQQRNFAIQDLCPIVEIITATDWDNFYELRLETREDGSSIARPEVYKGVAVVKAAIDASEPVTLREGQWALPLVSQDELYDRPLPLEPHQSQAVEPDPDERIDWRLWCLVSAGRCARISYDKHRAFESVDDSVARALMLMGAGHMSPYEMVARPFSTSELEVRAATRMEIVRLSQDRDDLEDAIVQQMIDSTYYCGNFNGWVQMRKTISGEKSYGLLKAAAA